MLNSIFIIQSLLYIPEIYNFEFINLSQDNKYIIDYKGDIIYGLCNLPEFILTKKIGINRYINNRSISLSIDVDYLLINPFLFVNHNFENLKINYQLLSFKKNIKKKNISTNKLFPIGFKQLLKKILWYKIILGNSSFFYIDLNLNMSNKEKEKYNSCSKNHNDLYLRKLICYPDKYYMIDDMIIKNLTVDNFKNIIRVLKRNQNLNSRYLLEQIDKFNNGSKNFCPICLQIINQKHFAISICGHIFCYHCIIDYLYQESNIFSKPCPICRTFLLSNNIYKLGNKNIFLKFENYHNKYLINNLGTKITFILKFCHQNKNKKILITSEYYSFLDKISQSLRFFNFNNLLINNNKSLIDQKYLINKFNNSKLNNILLIRPNNLYIKNIAVNNLSYILFSNIFKNKFDEYWFIRNLRLKKVLNLVKIILIGINNSIETF